MKDWEEEAEAAWVKLKYASEDKGTFTYGVKAGQFKRIAKELMRSAYAAGMERAAEIAESSIYDKHKEKNKIYDPMNEDEQKFIAEAIRAEAKAFNSSSGS